MRKEMYTHEDCIKLSDFKDVTGKVLVLKNKYLKPEYQKPKYQLWLAIDGFGTKNYTAGRMIYSMCIEDQEKSRWEDFQFIGVLEKELVQNLPKKMLLLLDD